MNHAARESSRSSHLWRRELCLTAVLGIGMLTGLLCYLMLGATSWPPLEVLRVLAGNQAGSTAYDVVWHLRLPRGLLACMIGAGFAVSGFILQIALRNPLADPGVVGVTGGASLAVVSVILLADVMPSWGVSAIPLSYLPAAAIVGGVGAMALVLALNWQHAANPAKLALYGVVLGALLNAAVMWVVVGWGGGRSEVTLMWLAGTLYGRDFQHVALLWPWLLLGFVSLVLMLRPLGLLRFEDHIAAALGLQVKFWRLLLVLIAVGLAASATAASGPMGFVGLVAPHWVRLFIKRYLWLQLIASALLGALLLLGADLLGRTLLVPLELPAGAMTTLIGIPLFLYLLFRHTGRGLHAKY